MKAPPIPDDEEARLAVLRAYDVLDTPAEAGFDDLTKIASHIFDVPIALVSLVDSSRQWFKSRVGLDAAETPREISFCGHAVASKQRLLVENALSDERFRDNPLVVGDPGVRFYSGTPLLAPSGHAMGTLCIIDRQPRQLSREQLEVLDALGRQVVTQLELRHHASEQARLVAILEASPDLIGMAGSRSKKFTYLNPAARRTLSVGDDRETWPDDLGVLLPAWAVEVLQNQAIPDAVENGVWVGELAVKNRDGDEVPTLQTVVAHRNHHGIVESVSTMARDITAWKELERQKSDFLSMASHELRTPLTSIRGSLGLIAGTMSDGLPEKTKTLVSIASGNAERLVRLVNDMLDLEKMKTGKLELRLESTDLVQIVREAVQENATYATELDVRLELAIGVDAAPVTADPDRLRQVLDNLLSNAAKFSTADSVVTARVRVTSSERGQPQRFRVEICDDGPGIPPEDRDMIFEPFAQVDQAPRSRSSTGLGLTICRRILGLHDGSIGFEPGAPRGSIFYFDLPASAEQRD